MSLELWLGFIISIMIILGLGSWDLSIALTLGSLVLGFYYLTPSVVFDIVISTLTNPSVISLSVAVGIIPLIGGALEASGMMDTLVMNVRLKKKYFLAVSASLIGLLPMPGGALLSAPLMAKGGAHNDPELATAINVWYRHVIHLVYPMSPSLIAAAAIAGVSLYGAIVTMIPVFIFMLLLGEFVYLRKVTGEIERTGPVDFTKIKQPLVVILCAPILDLAMRNLFSLPVPEMSTAISVTVSFLAAFSLGNLSRSDFIPIVKKMKPVKFSVLILSMFFFLGVFQLSGVTTIIASLNLPKAMVMVVLSFIMGVITGRVQVPASVVLPIYIAKFGTVSLPAFSIMYTSMFLGYMASPVHPCVCVSLEFFKTNFNNYSKNVMGTISAVLIALFLVSQFGHI